ncbi:MAG: formate/nitrite transporter family protein [Sphaerochaetaceae bacterium]|nr:formate/nitrite transporter family protein [Sphaerochaetaceae bacterium]
MILKSILAGFFISLGGCCFLSLDNGVIGALFFTVGLTAVLVFKLNLFTGKAGYVLDQMKEKGFLALGNLLVIWVLNFVGAAIAALMARCLPIYESIRTKVLPMVSTKVSLPWYSALVTGILCGVMMYLAVEGYNRCSRENRNVMGIMCYVLGVSVFIICKFEHSIADMFYFLIGSDNLSFFFNLLIISFGNILGAVIVNECVKEKRE